MKLSRLQELLEQGVAAGVFPAAQAAVLLSGAPAFEGHAGAATQDSVFDLASVTKAVGTTAAYMALWSGGLVGPETLVARFFPDAACVTSRVTLSDLLYHRSGLPAFLPFFADALLARPELLDPGCPGRARQDARAEVVRAVARTPLERPRGTAAVYSDVGFILLGECLARAAGKPLDAVMAERVFRPLSLQLRFHPLSRGGWPDAERSLPTGPMRPREPGPGQEGLWGKLPTRAARPGEVDDDNAWAMDGVAGHAGLFGTARALALAGQAVLDDLNGARRLAPPELWGRALAKDPTTPGSERASGWDTPAREASSAGRYLGQRPPGAVGHLGFTGVSLWVDRARSLVVALCTNCTQNGRANQPRIREFRPSFHDAVVEVLGLT